MSWTPAESACPTVFGVDVGARVVSIARISSAHPEPWLGSVEMPAWASPLHSSHSTWRHHASAAAEVYEILTVNETECPTLVLFSSFPWREAATDPSAFHRLHHITTLTNLLHAGQIPLADIPMPTAMRLGWERSPRKAVQRVWPGLTAPVDPRTGRPVVGFRLDVALLAAAAAMAVGITTAVGVTQERLDLLATGGQFPYARRPPRTVRKWIDVSVTGN